MPKDHTECGNMVDTWDYTVGTVVGVVLTILATYLTIHWTEKRQEKRERNSVASARFR